MKSKLRKILAFFMTTVITATALVVTASAESIEKTAKSVKSGSSVSIKLNTKDYHDYKVKLTKSGDLKININAPVEAVYVKVYDSDGEYVLNSSNDSEATQGSITYGYTDKQPICKWNSTLERFKGTLVYKDLDKGTYYIRIYNYDFARGTSRYSGTGKTTVKFTFPDGSDSKDNGSVSSSDGFILQLTLEEGDDIKLDALVSGNVTWSSSDETVASVSSSGKVRAIKPGKAVITAKSGKNAVKIQIKVVKDD